MDCGEHFGNCVLGLVMDCTHVTVSFLARFIYRAVLKMLCFTKQNPFWVAVVPLEQYPVYSQLFHRLTSDRAELEEGWILFHSCIPAGLLSHHTAQHLSQNSFPTRPCFYIPSYPSVLLFLARFLVLAVASCLHLHNSIQRTEWDVSRGPLAVFPLYPCNQYDLSSFFSLSVAEAPPYNHAYIR